MLAEKKKGERLSRAIYIAWAILTVTGAVMSVRGDLDYPFPGNLVEISLGLLVGITLSTWRKRRRLRTAN
jgi:hypothetical protein